VALSYYDDHVADDNHEYDRIKSTQALNADDDWVYRILYHIWVKHSSQQARWGVAHLYHVMKSTMLMMITTMMEHDMKWWLTYVPYYDDHNADADHEYDRI